MRILSILMVCILCVTMMVCFSSCSKPSEDSSTDTTPTTDSATSTTAPTVDIHLEDMVSAKDISEAIGTEMGEPTISTQGTNLTCIGKSSKTVLQIELNKKPIEIFYRMLAAYEDLQACPNLGETAWFSPIHNQLLVYGGGYMIYTM